MFHTTEDIRIQWTKVVLPPVFLEEERPVTEAASATIFNARNEISAILNGRDSRLLVLAGPCSIHDTKAAREYAALLKAAIEEFSADLRIVMRVYFEKPRTTIGWKGLINDPHLDQSYKINDGLRLARHLLLDLAEMGVPTGTEFLDMISPAVHCRPGQLGSHRRAHHREPGPPPTGQRRLLPGRLQERHLRQRADRHRRHPLRRPLPRLSRPHQNRPIGHPRHHGKSRHATSSCAAAAARSTTRPRASPRPPRRWKRPASSRAS